jgi:hypothetical protein
LYSTKTLTPLLGLAAAIAGAAFVLSTSLKAENLEPPVIPVGLDAYREWDHWDFQRIGARAYMRSTYDRRGGNGGADASHFLYQLSDTDNVTLDVAGTGVLYFVRYIYDLYVPGSRLSQPIRRWTTETVPDQDVLQALSFFHGSKAILQDILDIKRP